MLLKAEKLKADTMGNETKVPITDWIDIGVLDKEEENLIYQERIFVDRSEMTVKLLLDDVPSKAAIDPRRLLIDRVYSDNVKVVDAE